MFVYPPQAALNRTLPKSKIYGHAKPGLGIRERFVAQVSDIVWKYKLAPETLNLPGRAAVAEIQVSRLYSRLGPVRGCAADSGQGDSVAVAV